MQWQNHTRLIVRQLINDLDGIQYSDDRIDTAIVVSAQLVSLEMDFQNQYIMDIENKTISPDPISDNPFINLITVKSACIIIGGEIKAQSANAVAIKDGVSSIDMRGVTAVLLELYKDLCNRFDALVNNYGYSGSTGQSILGPYSPGSEYITRTNNDYNFRGNYFRY
jgi:hypothetical protein